MSVKIIVYMHITANGMIARLDGSEFSSKKARQGFQDMMAKVNVNIVGRNTFEMSKKNGSFPMKGLNIVITSHKIKNSFGKDVIITNSNPKKILEIVEKRGYKEAAVGGGVTAANFLKEGLVNEIFLDIEPIIFGRGIPVFAYEKFEKKLKLIDTKRISNNEIRLHYKVLQNK